MLDSVNHETSQSNAVNYLLGRLIEQRELIQLLEELFTGRKSMNEKRSTFR